MTGMSFTSVLFMRMIEPFPKSFSIFCITASSTLRALSALTGTFLPFSCMGITWFLFYSLFLVFVFSVLTSLCSLLVLSPLPLPPLPLPSGLLASLSFSHPTPSLPCLSLPLSSSPRSLCSLPRLGRCSFRIRSRAFSASGRLSVFIRSGNRMILASNLPIGIGTPVAVVADAEPPVGPFNGRISGC